MLQRANSLTARLIFVAILTVGLILTQGFIEGRVIGTLLVINQAIADAEDQENRILTMQNLLHHMTDNPDQQDAFLRQMQILIDGFEEQQTALLPPTESQTDDPAVTQILFTIEKTNSEWAATRVLLDEFMADPAEEQIEEIEAKFIATNIYANQTSEAFQAVAEREQRNVSWTFALIGVLTLAAVGVVVSLIIDVVREMRGLTRIAESLSGGTYSLRANTNGLTEIAMVGHTFNQMADSIQQREAALREANERLEQRVRERTIELEHAMNEAREASRAKDEFLSVMSHELRTPLNAILGYQGILELAGGLESDNLDMVQRTGANARRLLGLINDVLDISRIEAGRMAIVPSKLVIRDFVDQIRAQMEVLASEKGLQFNVQIDEALPSVIRIDEDALTKIVVNLLGNAFKFTHEGSISLSLKAATDSLQIAVSDTGIGIPLAMQHVVFERFRQVDSSTTRNYGGSGLGLSIVQQLCMLMGGTVVVNSVVNEGSTFTVTLPIEVVELEREEA